MRSMQVDYEVEFDGLGQGTDTYVEIADQIEWAKKGPEQDLQGHLFDEGNRFIDEVLGDAIGKTIVECGCGLGRNLHRFAKRNDCIGVDFSRVALGKIKAYGSGVFPVNGDIRQVPILGGTVDYVIFWNVLFLYEEPHEVAAMLREARRLLKPGGQVLVLNDYCSLGVKASPLFSFQSLMARRAEKQKQFFLQYYSESDTTNVLARAGLRSVRMTHCNAHAGTYHLTYLNPLYAILLRSHRKHRLVRGKDHWERVRHASQENDAYPLSLMGRMTAAVSRKLFPRMASMTLCCLAEPTSK